MHAQLCPSLCDPMDYNLPGSSVQARILEWFAISFSRGSSDPGMGLVSPTSSALQMDPLPGKPYNDNSEVNDFKK